MTRHFTAKASDYLKQLHEAGKHEEAHLQILRENGWRFDSATGIWTHPEKPGWIIER